MSQQTIQRALLSAVANNRIQVLNFLLQQGRSVNARDANGHTLLMVAATHGAKMSAMQLLRAKADTHAKAKNGTTALSIAHEGGQTTIAQWIQQLQLKEIEEKMPRLRI